MPPSGAILRALQEQVAQVAAALAAAQARISELEAQKTPPPAFVKPNVPERPKPPRKQRAPEHPHARRLETPPQIVDHRLPCCPTCQGRLSGVHLGRRRKARGPAAPAAGGGDGAADLAGLVVVLPGLARGSAGPHGAGAQAAGRSGVGIASLVAHRRLVVRAPLRVLQAWLSSGPGLRLWVGESSDRRRRVAAQGQATVTQGRERIRASPVVQADETPRARERAERVRLVRRDAHRRAVLRGPPQPGRCREQPAAGRGLLWRPGQ